MRIALSILSTLVCTLISAPVSSGGEAAICTFKITSCVTDNDTDWIVITPYPGHDDGKIWSYEGNETSNVYPSTARASLVKRSSG